MRGQSPASRGSVETRLGTTLRSFNDRLRALERARKVTIGNWRLEVDEHGSLVATDIPSGDRTVVAQATIQDTEGGT